MCVREISKDLGSSPPKAKLAGGKGKCSPFDYCSDIIIKINNQNSGIDPKELH